jgi:hypothetical protein
MKNMPAIDELHISLEILALKDLINTLSLSKKNKLSLPSETLIKTLLLKSHYILFK